MTRRALALFGGFWLLILVSPATGTVTSFTDNCYYCKYILMTGTAARCTAVPDGGEGNTICTQDDTLPWPAGPTCSVSGDACFNTVVSGGGGGSTGGGGGGGCSVSGGDPCPPWCGACNRTP